MVLQGDSSLHQVVDRDGIHETEGPLLAGGVELLASMSGLFTDTFVLEHLRTKQSFRDYLEFRQKCMEKAAKDLVSVFSSPVDLFLLTEADEKLFKRHFLRHMALRDEYSMFVTGKSSGSGTHNVSRCDGLDGDRILYKNEKVLLTRNMTNIWSYFGYRKSLLKLGIQCNDDPDEVLKRIKSTRWSELGDRELRRGLKSHMDLLKEHGSSLSETENVILERRIDSEMRSELKKLLWDNNRSLMDEYYYGMQIKNFARECATQAKNSGIILVEELLPVRERVKEPIMRTSLLSMKQRARQSLEGCLDYLRRGGAARGRRWPLAVFGVGAAAFGSNQLEPA
ncbi:hypothetical protein ACP70R_013285 [Stipagrostis hirtigluma subsp. patula]